MSRRGKHAAPRSKGRVTRRFRRVLPLSTAFLLAAGAVALAAELVTTAEVENVAATEVTVAQGETANFSIRLSATGALKCSADEDSPATARVDTAFSLDSAGNLTSGTPGTVFDFFSDGVEGGGPNCGITWTGAPTPYSQAASVSAHADTPVGSYTIVLSAAAGTTYVTTPAGSGGSLDDQTATSITVHVVAAGVDYTFDGFYQPVGGNSDDDPAFFVTAKAGQGIALKWNLYDGDDEVVTDASLYSARSSKFTCSLEGDGGDAVEDASSAGSSGFRYDADNEQSVYVWKTSKSWGGTCRTFELSYDGTVVATLDVHFTK